MRIGIDATALAPPRTGVGRYILPILMSLSEVMCSEELVLYTNRALDLTMPPNCRVVVGQAWSKGPIWQNVHLPALAWRDRLDAFWGTNGFLPLPLLPRVPMLVTIHDLVYHFVPDTLPKLSRYGRSVFQPLAAKYADRIISVSYATSADLQKIYGRSADTIVQPIITSCFQLERNEHQVEVIAKYQLHIPYLLAVGTLEPRKNIALLCNEYLALRSAGVDLPKLVLVGKLGWNHKLSRDIEKWVSSGDIRFLGFVPDEDLRALYANALAFVFPSIYEGFGMPVLEAQMCGTPVVYSQHQAIREAADGVGVEFAPTPEGLRSVLLQLAQARCPLTCRRPESIHNSAKDAALKVQAELAEAIHQRFHPRRTDLVE